MLEVPTRFGCRVAHSLWRNSYGVIRIAAVLSAIVNSPLEVYGLAGSGGPRRVRYNI